MLSTAAWAPSGSNLQPWRIYVVTGAPLAQLKKVAVERYRSLGIAREDWEALQRAAVGNWNCFAAPAAPFCYIDRDMGLRL